MAHDRKTEKVKPGATVKADQANAGNPVRAVSGVTDTEVALPPSTLEDLSGSASVQIDPAAFEPSMSVIAVAPGELDIATISLLLDSHAEAAAVDLSIVTAEGATLFEARPADAHTEVVAESVPLQLPDHEVMSLCGALPRRSLERIATTIEHAAKLRSKSGLRQQALDGERQRLSLVFEFSERVIQLAALDEVIARFLGDTARLLGAREGTFFALDQKRQDLYIRCHHGSRQEVVETFRLAIGEGIAGSVARDGRPRLVNDASSSPEYVAKNNPIKNIISAPVSVRDKLIGVVNINDRSDGERPFEERDLRLLTSLARLGGVALDNARLYGEVRELLLSTVEALTTAIDAKDDFTRGHSRRVAFIAAELAASLGLDEEERDRVRIAAMLHDVGNLAVSEQILAKQGPLDQDEKIAVKAHPALGASILDPVRQLADALPGILDHHERYDGRGYPRRLKGEEISLQGRLVAIAESYDAMTHDRPYRRGRPASLALRELQNEAGKQFDPVLIERFAELYERLALECTSVDDLLPSKEPDLDF